MKTALVVEDEYIIALDIKRILKNIGYEKVRICSDASEALMKIKEEDVDVITMDILLRGNKTGIEAAKEIKSISDAKIYFICGNDPLVFSKSFREVSDGYTLKPFKESELVHLVGSSRHRNYI